MRRAGATCVVALILLLGLAGPAAAQATTEGVVAPPAATGESPGGAADDPCADLRPWRVPGCRLQQNVEAGVSDVVTAGITSVFDQLYEWVAGGASWLLGQLVTLIDSSTRPNVGARWFGEQYRLMGGLAVALIMPLLMISTLTGVVRQDWRGLLRNYFVYLPAAMVGTALAIPLVDMSLEITDWMGSVFLDGMRGDVEGFTDTVSSALSTTAGVSPAGAGGVAPFLMFIGAAVIALGAFAVWVELVLRAAGIYVALFFMPLGFAALVWPSTRKWFGRLVKALAALILSKFVIVAVIALAAAALSNFTGPEGSGFGGVVAGSALMLMAAFSPLVLFRLADVAGDEMASAFGGITQHRTSPVPTPSAQQSASKLYGRIMNSRTAKDGAGMAAAHGASTAGLAAATGGAAAVAAGVATAVKAPKSAAETASSRMGEVAHANGAATGSNGNGRVTSGSAEQRPADRPPTPEQRHGTQTEPSPRPQTVQPRPHDTTHAFPTTDMPPWQPPHSQPPTTSQ